MEFQFLKVTLPLLKKTPTNPTNKKTPNPKQIKKQTNNKNKPLTMCAIPVQRLVNRGNFWTGNNLYLQSQNKDKNVHNFLPGKGRNFLSWFW